MIIDTKQIKELLEICEENNLNKKETDLFVNFMVRFDPFGSKYYAEEMVKRLFEYDSPRLDLEYEEMLDDLKTAIMKGNYEYEKMDTLLGEHMRERTEYQRNCPHEKQTEWIRVGYAIGHSSSLWARYCERCEEIMERKATCNICGKYVTDKDWVEGDGRCNEVLNNFYYHKDCIEEHECDEDCKFKFDDFFEKEGE